jgi:hypothetical protein
MTQKQIQKLVYNYPTMYAEGFTNKEVKDLASKIPNINMKKVNNSLYCNTCIKIENELINYHHDVLLAITCGVQNRDVNIEEWD